MSEPDSRWAKSVEGELYDCKTCSHLKDNASHELWMRLLTGQKLSDHFVHDVLWREKVCEECREDTRDHSSLVRETLPDSASSHIPWDTQHTHAHRFMLRKILL